MMDDGGSNIVVRDEFGLLPLSDVRKSILALADSQSNEVLKNFYISFLRRKCNKEDIQ